MPELIPHGILPPKSNPDDPRVGHLLGSDLERADVVIVGFPSEEGVRRNGGRVGAAEGPSAIREALHRLTPDARDAAAFTDLLQRTLDAGDVPVKGDVEADQEALGRAIAPYLGAGKTVIVLGGGHETTFGHFLGYVEAGLNVDILNIDAHTDVRPLVDGKAHSGSPFRQAIEHPSGRCTRYRVAGLQPHATAASHADYVIENGGEIVWLEALDRGLVDELSAGLQAPSLATFDLDAVDASHAPGVSAPNAGGMEPSLWLHAAEILGRNRAVRSFDLVELCPPLDADGRSARLAALTIWRFLKGVSAR